MRATYLLSVVLVIAFARSPGVQAQEEQGTAIYTKNPAQIRANKRRFTPLIRQVARLYRLETALVHAVVAAESAYDPNAVSTAGAVGLMQLMPQTARRYGVKNRRDPLQNVLGGVRYLRDLLLQFNELPLALAAYNAGEKAVVKYGHRIPPYPETRDYVRKVLNYYQKHRVSS